MVAGLGELPLPPAMMRPAWPMRLPGGAFWPAMKATTGLLIFGLDELGGLLLGRAADLADHHHGLRVGSASKSARASMKLVPITGSPPMPTQVD